MASVTVDFSWSRGVGPAWGDSNVARAAGAHGRPSRRHDMVTNGPQQSKLPDSRDWKCDQGWQTGMALAGPQVWR